MSSGPPEELKAGTYLSPEGFEPELSVDIPKGWYGGGGHEGFGAGYGLDEVEERFASGGFFVDRLPVSYDEAVRALQGLVALNAGAGKKTTFAGQPAHAFRPEVSGEPVLLDPLGGTSDVGENTADVIVVEVGGHPLLVRTEVFDPAFSATLKMVLATIRAT